MVLLTNITSFLGLVIFVTLIGSYIFSSISYRAYKYKNPNPVLGWDNKER